MPFIRLVPAAFVRKARWRVCISASTEMMASQRAPGALAAFEIIADDSRHVHPAAIMNAGVGRHFVSSLATAKGARLRPGRLPRYQRCAIAASRSKAR